jgi:hypothetical protein
MSQGGARYDMPAGFRRNHLRDAQSDRDMPPVTGDAHNASMRAQATKNKFAELGNRMSDLDQERHAFPLCVCACVDVSGARRTWRVSHWSGGSGRCTSRRCTATGPFAVRRYPATPAGAIERYSDLLALQKISRQLEERSHALEVRTAYSISSEW